MATHSLIVYCVKKQQQINDLRCPRVKLIWNGSLTYHEGHSLKRRHFFFRFYLRRIENRKCVCVCVLIRAGFPGITGEFCVAHVTYAGGVVLYVGAGFPRQNASVQSPLRWRQLCSIKGRWCNLRDILFHNDDTTIAAEKTWQTRTSAPEQSGNRDGARLPEDEATPKRRTSATDTHKSVGFRPEVPEYVREVRKMNPMIGSGSDRTAMELLAGGGLALLPWTRHLLAALWEQVRLLLQVIYCTFISGESRHFRVLLPLFLTSRSNK